MYTIWIFLIIIQCLTIYLINKKSAPFILKSNKKGENYFLNPTLQQKIAIEFNPTVLMIIPVAGQRPEMEQSLRSLLQQKYDNIITVMVTADINDPAVMCIKKLQSEFPKLQHVVAGISKRCGQKNHNILQALAKYGSTADIYVFCDSCHEAQDSFIYELIRPIVLGEANISTGYHYVEALDNKVITIAYQFCVLLMRSFQVLSSFTQPWGGALAISRLAFVRYNLAKYWSTKVVDDCSLAAYLLKKNIYIKQCPKAMLKTVVKNHNAANWKAWIDRQILFLKFCIPSQYILLGIFSLIIALPIIIDILLFMGILLGLAPIFLLIPILLHLIILNIIILKWRSCLPKSPHNYKWLIAFYLSILQFSKIYIHTISAKTILWNNIIYVVGKRGKVINIEDKKS